MFRNVHQNTEEHIGDNQQAFTIEDHIEFEEDSSGQIIMSYDDTGKKMLDDLMKLKGFTDINQLMEHVLIRCISEKT